MWLRVAFLMLLLVPLFIEAQEASSDNTVVQTNDEICLWRLLADTAFPAFNREVTGERGRDAAVQFLSQELNGFAVTTNSKALYTLLLRLSSCDCAEVVLDDDTNRRLAQVTLRLLLYDVRRQDIVCRETVSGFTEMLPENAGSDWVPMLRRAWQEVLPLAGKVMLHRLIERGLSGGDRPQIKRFASMRQYMQSKGRIIKRFSGVRPPVDVVKMEAVPHKETYAVGETVAIKVEAQSQGNTVPDAQFVVSVPGQPEPRPEAIPGLYEWTPNRAGESLIVAYEKLSGQRKHLPVKVAGESEKTSDNTRRSRRFMNLADCLLGRPPIDRMIRLEARLNKPQFVAKEPLQITFCAAEDGYVYVLNAMPDKGHMIVPWVKCTANAVTGGQWYTYPNDFKVARFSAGNSDELYLVVVSTERIDALDGLLQKACEEAARRDAAGEKYSRTASFTLSDARDIGEELTGLRWGCVRLEAKVK